MTSFVYAHYELHYFETNNALLIGFSTMNVVYKK